MGVNRTVTWAKSSPPYAVIIGGRWDGHSVLYMGPVVEWKGETYVAMKTDDGRYLYLLEPMISTWFASA